MRASLSLGSCSFGVYLSHLVFLFIIRHFLPFVGLLGAVAAMALTLGVSWGFVLFGQRILDERIVRVLGLR